MTNRTDFDRQLMDLLPQMKAYAVARLRNLDEAEDLTSRVALSMLVNWRQYRPGTHFKAWAYRILNNEMIDDRRRAHRRRGDSFDHDENRTLEHCTATPARQDGDVAVSEIMTTINIMAPLHRDILISACVLGETYEGMAVQYNVSVDTIKSRIWRARDALQRRLGLNDAVL